MDIIAKLSQEHSVNAREQAGLLPPSEELPQPLDVFLSLDYARRSLIIGELSGAFARSCEEH